MNYQRNKNEILDNQKPMLQVIKACENNLHHGLTERILAIKMSVLSKVCIFLIILQNSF